MQRRLLWTYWVVPSIFRRRAFDCTPLPSLYYLPSPFPTRSTMSPVMKHNRLRINGIVHKGRIVFRFHSERILWKYAIIFEPDWNGEGIDYHRFPSSFLLQSFLHLLLHLCFPFSFHSVPMESRAYEWLSVHRSYRPSWTDEWMILWETPFYRILSYRSPTVSEGLRIIRVRIHKDNLNLS